MALLMSLILGSGLPLLLATQPSLKITDMKTIILTKQLILTHHIEIVIAHTQRTINHMNVKQVHLKDSLQVQ